MTRREFMATTGMGGATLAARPLSPKRPPNVVFILCDDLGHGDVGCYGSGLATPNLDRMASEGIRFTQAYASSPNCSPSRAGLLTGRYPVRTGIPRVLNPPDTYGLLDSEVTLAQALKPAGYRTMCIGKWHLGHLPKYLPTNRGFDEYFGIPYSNDMKPCPLLHNLETIEEPARQDTLTRRYTEQAVRFIESSKDSPFFLYLPHTFPHIPLAASEKFFGKSHYGLYGDTVSEIDWSVGEVLSTLKRLKLDENTLVFFSSDNGPWYQGSPGKARGRKHLTWDGGIHVPLLARMPGRIPGKQVSKQLVSLMDVFPTVTRLCGTGAPRNPLDGVDIWPLLSGRTSKVERDVMLFFQDVNLQCARLENWKLHITRYNWMPSYNPLPAEGWLNLPLHPPELYDILADSDESYDVADRHPEIVRDILARVDRALPTFSQDIQQTFHDTMQIETAPQITGDVPARAKKPKAQ
jgi:arylsulfatase